MLDDQRIHTTLCSILNRVWINGFTGGDRWVGLIIMLTSARILKAAIQKLIGIAVVDVVVIVEKKNVE